MDTSLNKKGAEEDLRCFYVDFDVNTFWIKKKTRMELMGGGEIVFS